MEIKLNRNKELPNGWTVKEAYGYFKDIIKEAKEEGWENKDMSFWQWLDQLIVVNI